MNSMPGCSNPGNTSLLLFNVTRKGFEYPARGHARSPASDTCAAFGAPANDFRSLTALDVLRSTFLRRETGEQAGQCHAERSARFTSVSRLAEGLAVFDLAQHAAADIALAGDLGDGQVLLQPLACERSGRCGGPTS
jgi:hypothetical protein